MIWDILKRTLNLGQGIIKLKIGMYKMKEVKMPRQDTMTRAYRLFCWASCAWSLRGMGENFPMKSLPPLFQTSHKN